MDMQKEREAFEDWARSKGKYVQVGSNNEYISMTLNESWEAWQAAKAQAIPDGFVLVPKEPTEKMLDAARRRQWDDFSSPLEDMDVLKYKVMIEAAQEQNQ